MSLMPAVLHASDTLGTATQLLASSGLHRLYIVDDTNTPVGVLTLTDVVKAVADAL